MPGSPGGYLLRDSFDTGSNPLLPGPIGVYELPMVVQDRQFNSDGSLLYPVAPASTNGPWIGEYFGDVMLVNGKIWPTLAVEPAVYRFRVLNGCNARILNLRIPRPNDSATVPMYIIGTEGGLLPAEPGPLEQAGDGPGRAVRRDLRLPGFRGPDAAHEEHQPAEPGRVHPGATVADKGHADHGEIDGDQRRADDRSRGRVAARQPGR